MKKVDEIAHSVESQVASLVATVDKVLKIAFCKTRTIVFSVFS